MPNSTNAHQPFGAGRHPDARLRPDIGTSCSPIRHGETVREVIHAARRITPGLPPESHLADRRIRERWSRTPTDDHPPLDSLTPAATIKLPCYLHACVACPSVESHACPTLQVPGRTGRGCLQSSLRDLSRTRVPVPRALYRQDGILTSQGRSWCALRRPINPPRHNDHAPSPDRQRTAIITTIESLHH